MKNSKITVLNGQKAQKWIDTIVAKNDFLKAIRVAGTEQNSGNVTMLDTEDYGLVLPTNRQTAVTFSMETSRTIAFDCKEIAYPKLISDSDLEDMGISPAAMENLNAGDGKKVADVIGTAFGKNLQDLIINGDESASGTGRTAMLAQKDGIVALLDDASQVITDSSYNTVLKEIAALYEAHIANEHHTPDDAIYVGWSQWAQLVKVATTTSHQLTYANGKLYYIDALVIPTSRMTNAGGVYQMLIGNPKAVVAKIKREIIIEIARSIEYRGWKYLITTRIDWPVLTEFFYALTHTTS